MRAFRMISVAIAVMLATLAAAAQSASAPRDPFTHWNTMLSSAADAALARTADSLPPPSPETSVPRNSRPEVVREFAHQYWNGKEDSLRLALARVHELRPMIEPILRQQQVPPELIAAVLVESAGRSSAVSSRGARGVWQLMPDTARRYGLKVSAAIDERLDVAKSTRAAARYLYDLHAQFGSWPLALAAYNAGESTVQRALDRAGTGDFLGLSGLLPAETRTYVPAVWSAAHIFEQAGAGGLE